ncbi:MAG: 5-formyltetrahydrofolate cyclo-ligase [Wenzhouxiangellaceae bacterium]
MTDSTQDRKAALRARLVETRASIHPHQRQRANRQICAHLLRLLGDRDYLDVAAFMPFRGEPDLVPAMQALSEAGRRIWLPVVDGPAMTFRRWLPGMQMKANRFGIPEPVDSRECEPERLELVLTPLVAFSGNGARLGMGAGFYDRTFAFANDNPSAGPWMVGMAYALQQVDGLPSQPWDVPLGAVITERGLQVFKE